MPSSYSAHPRSDRLFLGPLSFWLEGQMALRLYRQMTGAGVRQNAYTFVSLPKVCGSVTNLEEGKRIQAEAVKYRAKRIKSSSCTNACGAKA